MHTAYVSAQTAERRRQNVEDVRKRSEFRKAHGLNKEGAFGGWEARTDEDVRGAGMREGGSVVAAVQSGGAGTDGEYTDFQGTRRPVVKKWFGIW